MTQEPTAWDVTRTLAEMPDDALENIKPVHFTREELIDLESVLDDYIDDLKEYVEDDEDEYIDGLIARLLELRAKIARILRTSKAPS